MNKIIICGVTSALLALSVSSAASAGERLQVRRHAHHPVAMTGRHDPRDAYAYYPGWGRDAVPLYGVPAGLVYGGATSPPVGH